MVAAALIDRLVHHATMIALKGKSYRLRERAAASSDKPRRRARPTSTLMNRGTSLAGYAGSHPHTGSTFQFLETGSDFGSC